MSHPPPPPHPATGGGGGVIAAVIENRAGEVGAAFYDGDRVRAGLGLVIEPGHACYGAAASLLAAHRAAGTLVCLDADAAGTGPVCVAASLQARGAVARLAPLPRHCFDDAAGALLLERLAVAGTAPPAAGPGRPPYLALAAAAALLTHLGRAAPPAGSLTIVAAPPGQYVALDPATVAALHLVRGPGGRRAGSLLASLDSTRTAVGGAWLRTAVLQPLAHAPSLRLRHAAVAELVGDPGLGASLDASLASLPRELGKLYGWMALRPLQGGGRGGGGGGSTRGGSAGALPPTARVAGLARALTLARAALAGLPALAASLGGARAELLRAAGATLAHPAVAALGPALDTVLAPPPAESAGEDRDEGGDGKGGEAAAAAATHQDCFAVRVDAAAAAAAAAAAGDPTDPPLISPGDTALLAAAREALTSAAGAAASLLGAYREATGPAGRRLRLHHAQRRGFYLTLSLRGGGGGGGGGGCGGGVRAPAAPHALSLALPPDLPADLAVTGRRGASCVELTSPELGAINARARAAAEDCLALSAAALAAAVARVTTGPAGAALQKAVDAVALVDGLASLARAAASCPVPAVCPTIAATGGPTVLAGLRDPLLLAAAAAAGLDGGGAVRPNDACFSPGGAALGVVAGPNSAGKSTYLRAVGTGVVLAHIGAHVPADHAMVALVNRVVVCGGGGGDAGNLAGCLETGGSALGVEMRGIAAALSGAGPATLLLLDEPGRAASTADGVALAWAVAEAALAARAPTLVSTHFPRLARLAGLYPTVRAYHMGARVAEEGGEGGEGGTASPGGAAASGGGVVGALPPARPTAAPAPAALSFTWRLRPGPCRTRHYGLAVAPRAGMAASIVAEAAAIAARIEADQAGGGGGGEGGGGDADATDPAASPSHPHAVDHALHSVAHRLATLANAWVAGAADADVAVALVGLKGVAAAAVAAASGGA